MRPGYLLSQEKNIKELRKVRGPYDVNMGAVSILKALKYTDTRNEMMNYINEVMKLAKPTTENFLRKNGIKYYESSSNFILIDPTPLNSIEIYDFLKSYDNPKYRGILVRPRTDPPNTFRLTIGRNKDMDYFMDAFDAYLKKKGK
jgi:histidinol-phosphate/aromatic aminotransferase/cobyric acid decarboxylase-like protein